MSRLTAHEGIYEYENQLGEIGNAETVVSARVTWMVTNDHLIRIPTLALASRAQYEVDKPVRFEKHSSIEYVFEYLQLGPCT